MDEMKGLKLLEEPFVDWETSKKMKAGESVEFEVEFDFDALREKARLASSRTGDCYLHCLMAPLGLDDSGRYRVLVEVQDITERKLADERIRASLREKEVLLKEIHHRVKNNLQIISSLLNLQSKYIKDVSAIEMFKESRNRIRSMTLIHEKLYRSKDLAHIDLPEYIQNLSSNLFRSYNSGSVTLKTQIDDILLGIDTAIPCGLIINELVSNSLKHAFPEHRGEITVSLLWNDPNYTLMVKDTGKGFPADVDFRNTESLGLQLVCTLTEQLSGEIVLDRSNGTAWSITFQELKYKERA
jgi:two-component sensor histidine kinase